VKTEFWRRLGDRKFEDVLLYSQEYTPPTRYDPNKVKILCRIPYKIPYSKINEAPAQTAEITGKKFREAHMDVHVCLKCAVLEFRLLHGGKSYGFAEALYVDP
jgi:hypothetical protein